MSSVQKQIKRASLLILGCEAEPWPDVWGRIDDLSDAYGQTKVVEAFETWAKSRENEIITRPVGEFLRVAIAVLKGARLLSHPDLMPLLKDLTYAGDDNIAFTKEQQAVIGQLLNEYKPEEILSAFKAFYERIDGDDFAVRTAGKTFTESVELLLSTQRRRREEARKQAETIKRLTEQEQQKAENERLERQRAEEAENALIEDTLPD